MIFTIFTKELEHQFLFNVDMKKKDRNLAWTLLHSKLVCYGAIWYLEANAEQQATVNDLTA